MAELAKKMDQAAEDISDREGKYLTFTMAEVRGKVIPVVDLRLRFGMEKMEYKDRTCIIVVEIAGSTGTVQIGIVVDSVSEGLYIKGEDIEDTPTPTFGTKLNIDYIPGMAKMEGGVKIMIDREGRYLTFTMAEVRGKVIPVVDLRLRFGMEKMEYTDRTCIIVVEIAGSTGTVQIGIVVDSVSEGLYIKGEDIEDTPTPTFGTKLNIDYIPGMAKMEGGVKIMIGIDKVLFHQELELVSAVKKKDSPVAAEASKKKNVAEEALSEKTKEAESPSEKKVVSEASPEKTVAREAPPEQVPNKSKGDRDKQYFNKSSIYAFVLLTLFI